MDMKESAGKVASNIIKRSKSSDYEDGNTTVAWKGLKKKLSNNSAVVSKTL